MKNQIENIPLIHPTTIVLVGTMFNEKPNFTAIGDVAVAGLNPQLIMISLHENHNATKSIRLTNKFSINLPEENLLSEVDFAGVYSSKTKDKSDLVKSYIVDGLPIVEQSPISLLVEVLDSVQVEQRVIFVCKVYKTLVDEKIIEDDKLNLSKIKPILYGLDNSYYSIGNKIGTGYQEWKNTKDK